MKRLIINADDLGLSVKINEGIFTASRDGCVRSTTALTGAPAFEDGLERVSSLYNVGIGIHLNLTGSWDDPGTSVPAGFFRGTPSSLLGRCLAGRADLDFAEGCLRKQVEAFLETGRRPTHVDGHHHVHIFPGIASRIVKLAREYGIRRVRLPLDSMSLLRTPRGGWFPRLLVGLLSRRARRIFRQGSLMSPDRFLGFGMMGRRDFKERFIRILECGFDGTSELMVHPGMPGDGERLDFFSGDRSIELKALTASDTMEIIEEHGYRLVSFEEMDSQSGGDR